MKPNNPTKHVGLHQQESLAYLPRLHPSEETDDVARADRALRCDHEVSVRLEGMEALVRKQPLEIPAHTNQRNLLVPVS